MEMFDSRSKVLTPEAARAMLARAKAEGRAPRAVAAFCDPLLPALVERWKAEAGEGRLFVFLATPPDAYFEAAARAELAAALRFVEGVVIAPGDVLACARDAGFGEVADGRECESALRAEFVRFARGKASPES